MTADFYEFKKSFTQMISKKIVNSIREIISRHPFPGQGLAIRMPRIITKKKINILKEADYYFIKALKDHSLYNKIW